MIIVIFIVGVIFLIAGAKIMVEGAKDIANHFHISSLAIGLTIVAFSTSIPELLVSVKAMYEGYNNIVIFDLIGSNILNILLILSIVSFIKPLKITNSTIKKELPLSILATAIFTILALDDIFIPSKTNQITRLDALVLILFFIIYIFYMVKNIRSRSNIKTYESSNYPLSYSIFMTILGFSMIFLGSIFTVDMAYKLTSFGVSDKILSVSIIAFATSIPELITCLYFMKNNDEDMIIGNILGSNIFNICIALAIPVIIMGALNINALSIIDIVNFLLSALILVLFAPIKEKIGKFESTIMIIIFVIYYGYMLWEGLGI